MELTFLGVCWMDIREPHNLQETPQIQCSQALIFQILMVCFLVFINYTKIEIPFCQLLSKFTGSFSSPSLSFLSPRPCRSSHQRQNGITFLTPCPSLHNHVSGIQFFKNHVKGFSTFTTQHKMLSEIASSIIFSHSSLLYTHEDLLTILRINSNLYTWRFVYYFAD